MEALMMESHGILEQINALFSQLEKRAGRSNELELEEAIHLKLESVMSKFERLDRYVSKEPPNRKQASRLKFDQLKYDTQHMQAALKSFQQKRMMREREQQEREELLSRRFVSNSKDTSIQLDASLHHHDSLQRANRGVDDLIGNGYAILGNLRDQRQMLNSSRKKMMSLLNTLGLSNTVIQMVERRAKQDKYILFGGMIGTLLIVVILYFYIL